jgi:YidC/Oxa1 family membrane protein insertase
MYASFFVAFPLLTDLHKKSSLADDYLYDSIYKLPFNIPFYSDHVFISILAAIAIFSHMKMTTEIKPCKKKRHSKNKTYGEKL